MTVITLKPDRAYRKHIQFHASKDARWIENGKPINKKELNLRRREVFGLILLAHMRNHQYGNQNWKIGYDTEGIEPNDGFVSDGDRTTLVEHKLVAQMDKREALEAILSTYDKYAKLGDAYGGKRTLLIHTNRASNGMIKISDLKEKIQGDSPFDQVLLIGMVATQDKGRTGVFHITEHYPSSKANIAQIDFDWTTGRATIPVCEIDPI